jgi:O-acetyl-ADP-ribose deacetylase (regulator of RNase III)
MNENKAKIHYLTGDLTKPQGAPGAKFIFHCCNDEGFFGAGVSGALSRKWKLVETAYRHWAKRLQADGDKLPLGAIQSVDVEPDIRVINLIGQRGIRSKDNPVPVDYRALVDGFEKIAREAIARKATLHCPKIGSGLAGGDWDHIEKLLSVCFVEKGLDVFVYTLPEKRAGQSTLF